MNPFFHTLSLKLDFSKIEAGKLELENCRLNILQTVQHIIRLMETKAVDKGLSMLCTFQEGIPECVWGDPMRLKQILMNLVSTLICCHKRQNYILTIPI